MNKNIIIIGTGINSDIILDKAKHLGINDVVLVDFDKTKEQLPFPKSEPILYRTPYPPTKEYPIKKIICKGRHEYKLSHTTTQENIKIEVWICKCGKVLG